MKKAALTIIYTIILSLTVFSQCPTNIYFITQEQIDDFPIQYPNCTEVTGYIEIRGDNIINLDGLINLSSIGQGLAIDYNPDLIDITGLNNLISIGDHLHISYNDVLSSLSGLANLTTVGGHGITITHNNSLINLDGLQNISSVDFFDISSNSSLESLTGLNNLSNISANAYLTITANNSLLNLEGLENLTYIEGSIGITDNEQLINLEGLNYLDSIGGGFHFSRNDVLEEITALANIKKIGEGLILRENYNLQSLSGLNSLNSIGGDLEIRKCNKLINLNGLESLLSIGGKLDIYENNDLENLNGIDNIDKESISDLKITFNPILSYCEVVSICDYVFNPNGDIEIHSNYSGCNNSQEIGYACTVDRQEIKDLDSYLLYPNPVKNSLFISSKTNSGLIYVTIFNNQGKKVLSQNGILDKIDISFLESGIYFIELISKEQVIKEKLIKI